MSKNSIRKLIDHIECTMSETDVELGYHPTEIESALVECVFAARATYGSPTTGVRGVLARWRGHRGGSTLDDLGHLAVFADDPGNLEEVFHNRQRVPGNYVTKAEAVALAAQSLTELGCAHVSALAAADDLTPYRVAFESVPGLGRRTWEHFTMHAGTITPAAEALIVDYVSAAVGSQSDKVLDVHSLVDATAHRLLLPPDQLRYGIWRHRKEQQRVLLRTARAARSA
ncbi:hypothetical protein [Rhodococcus sp. NPDC058521]|uniref:hypothetical protein n=1 Tax=Rhodococcus sp. NPDC058521 TaxID=3346536 RepID=UPI003655FCD8